MLSAIRKLWAHLAWADGLLLEALRAGPAPPGAVREYAHIMGAEEIWLARLEQRASRAPVWPDLPLDQLVSLAGTLQRDYTSFLDRLDHRTVSGMVAYTNSAGVSFENSIEDILLHVALHGQYHRGKINLILRQEGRSPAPTDYIAHVRGVAAARTDPGRLP
jgi:uncharacterized damage-inducible protein DinB